MAKKKYSYDEAVDYIEENGVGCDPCSDDEGEYVCDLLDDEADGYDEEYEEDYYYKETLDSIIERGKKYKEEQEDEDDEEEDWDGTVEASDIVEHSNLTLEQAEKLAEVMNSTDVYTSGFYSYDEFLEGTDFDEEYEDLENDEDELDEDE